ncbi:MAG: TolC family protein [Comamonas sp.]
MSCRNPSFALLALCAALAALPAAAQETRAPAAAPEAASASAPAQITLTEYLQLVARNNPQLMAQRLEVKAAEADTTTAGAWPNPTVSYNRHRFENSVSVEQPLPIFGQRSQRIKTARQAEQAAAMQVQGNVQELVNGAAHAFIEVQIAQQKLALWQAGRDDFAKAERVVNGQIEAGARSRYDGARVAMQRAQVEVQLKKANAELQEAVVKMAALAAMPAWRPQAFGSLKPLPPQALGGFDTLWEQAQGRLPAIRTADAELELARQQVLLQKREAMPAVAVNYGRIRNRNDGNYNQVGVSVEVPLFDRKQGAIARAEVGVVQAEHRREAAEVAAKAELVRSLQQLDLKREALRDFEDSGMAQMGSLRQMTEDAYRLGKSSILDLIDALQTLHERRMDHLDLTKEMLEAEWELRLASGNVPAVE